MTVAEVERIGEEQLPAARAAAAVREYRQAMLEERDPRLKAEYAALWRANRARANGELLLDIHAVFKQTGLQPLGHRLPRLAFCQADATWCHVYMTSEGGAIFRDRTITPWRRMAAESLLRLPDDTFARLSRVGWNEEQRPCAAGKAMVPMVPPHGRPARGLRGYHILWDAVWERDVPKDPFLLKHCGGALYAVVFHWDLTPLEQAVMRGRLR